VEPDTELTTVPEINTIFVRSPPVELPPADDPIAATTSYAPTEKVARSPTSASVVSDVKTLFADGTTKIGIDANLTSPSASVIKLLAAGAPVPLLVGRVVESKDCAPEKV